MSREVCTTVDVGGEIEGHEVGGRISMPASCSPTCCFQCITMARVTIPAMHPHALSCHYQPPPCTLVSLPATPMHSRVTTSHPHALSCHYQPPPCTLVSLYIPDHIHALSLPAIPMHSLSLPAISFMPLLASPTPQPADINSMKIRYLKLKATIINRVEF